MIRLAKWKSDIDKQPRHGTVALWIMFAVCFNFLLLFYLFIVQFSFLWRFFSSSILGVIFFLLSLHSRSQYISHISFGLAVFRCSVHRWFVCICPCAIFGRAKRHHQQRKQRQHCFVFFGMMVKYSGIIIFPLFFQRLFLFHRAHTTLLTSAGCSALTFFPFSFLQYFLPLGRSIPLLMLLFAFQHII